MPAFAKVIDFTRGWIIGDFEPSLYRSKDFEICITRHLKGEESIPHFHTRSEEINVVIAGSLTVNGRSCVAGDVFIYDRGEISAVEFLSDTQLVVIRIPSAPGDKVIA